MHLGDLRFDGPGVHPLIPVGVVQVRDLERDRAAERPAVPDPAADRDAIALDLHPPAAAVAELPARQIAIDRVPVDLEARGKTVDDAGEAGAMGLAGGDQMQLGHLPGGYGRAPR